MKIINSETFNTEILPIYKNSDKAFLFGKGTSFKVINEKENNELFVCVNNTLDYIDKCDFFITNDYNHILNKKHRIDLKKLKNIKNILIPYSNQFCDLKEGSYHKIINAIKNHFDNNLILYNMVTRTKQEPNNEYLTLNLVDIASGHNGFEFINKYLPQIKLIDCYGFCTNNYHTLFGKQLNPWNDNIIKINKDGFKYISNYYNNVEYIIN